MGTFILCKCEFFKPLKLIAWQIFPKFDVKDFDASVTLYDVSNLSLSE